MSSRRHGRSGSGQSLFFFFFSSSPSCCRYSPILRRPRFGLHLSFSLPVMVTDGQDSWRDMYRFVSATDIKTKQQVMYLFFLRMYQDPAARFVSIPVREISKSSNKTCTSSSSHACIKIKQHDLYLFFYPCVYQRSSRTICTCTCPTRVSRSISQQDRNPLSFHSYRPLALQHQQ